jgi:hypothetical protein
MFQSYAWLDWLPFFEKNVAQKNTFSYKLQPKADPIKYLVTTLGAKAAYNEIDLDTHLSFREEVSNRRKLSEAIRLNNLKQKKVVRPNNMNFFMKARFGLLRAFDEQTRQLLAPSDEAEHDVKERGQESLQMIRERLKQAEANLKKRPLVKVNAKNMPYREALRRENRKVDQFSSKRKGKQRKERAKKCKNDLMNQSLYDTDFQDATNIKQKLCLLDEEEVKREEKKSISHLELFEIVLNSSKPIDFKALKQKYTILDVNIPKYYDGISQNPIHRVFNEPNLFSDNMSNLPGDNVAKQKRIALAVESLIQMGANINVRDGYGNTALHYAMIQENGKAVSHLVNARAKPNIVNNNADTPLLALINKEWKESDDVSVRSSLVNRYVSKYLSLNPDPAIINNAKEVLAIALASKNKEEAFANFIKAGIKNAIEGKKPEANKLWVFNAYSYY